MENPLKTPFWSGMRTWDRLGVLLSGLCIIHCISVPLIVLVAPLLGFNVFLHNDLTHILLLIFILAVAIMAFVSGYRVHRDPKPILLMLVGIGFLVFAVISTAGASTKEKESFLGIIGSAFLIWAHFKNQKLCYHCANSTEPHHR